MQKYFVFDTEGTGLNKTMKDEVIQLSGFLLNENLDVIQIVDIYCNTTSPIPKESIAVHGITDKFLQENANNMFLEDYLALPEYKWLADPHDLTVIGYNTSFDTKLINTTLHNNGYATINFGIQKIKLPKSNAKGNYVFDMMKACQMLYGYRNYKKLSEVIKLQVLDKKNKTEQDLFSYFQKFCKSKGFTPKACSFHTALFDAFCVYLLIALNEKRLINA